jgi:D-serine dehydratase
MRRITLTAVQRLSTIHAILTLAPSHNGISVRQIFIKAGINRREGITVAKGISIGRKIRAMITMIKTISGQRLYWSNTPVFLRSTEQSRINTSNHNTAMMAEKMEKLILEEPPFSGL